MSRKRVIFLVISVVLLAIGGIGWWWVYSLMHYDVTEAELGVEVGFFDFQDLITVPDTGIDFSKIQQPTDPVVVDSSGEPSTPKDSNEQTGSQSSSTTIGNANAGGQSSTTDSKQNNQTETQVVLSPEQKLDIIREQYFQSFTQLQNVALSRIDTLVQLAKDEYKKKKNEKGFSKIDLASKYMSAGNKLQAEVDKVFYQVLEQMKKDLQANDLPLDLAKEAEKEYKRRIEEKKEELMSKFL